MRELGHSHAGSHQSLVEGCSLGLLLSGAPVLPCSGPGGLRGQGAPSGTKDIRPVCPEGAGAQQIWVGTNDSGCKYSPWVGSLVSGLSVWVLCLGLR